MSSNSPVLSLCQRISQWLGSLSRGLGLLMMLVLVALVILRYGFDTNWIAVQELVIYLHATALMLGMGYALQQDSHVRVDIFYRRFSRRQQAWVNCVGCLLFLLPFSFSILLLSSDYVSQSWQISERSAEPGGLPAVFLLKSLIPAMAICLALQGIANLVQEASILIYPTPKAESTDA